MLSSGQEVRQLTHKGDPRLNVKLPKALKMLMIGTANNGKRRLQDEVIKRLAATIKNDKAYQVLKDKVAAQIKQMA